VKEKNVKIERGKYSKNLSRLKTQKQDLSNKEAFEGTNSGIIYPGLETEQRFS